MSHVSQHSWRMSHWERCQRCVSCQMSHVSGHSKQMSHVACVMSHVSRVMSHESCVMSHVAGHSKYMSHCERCVSCQMSHVSDSEHSWHICHCARCVSRQMRHVSKHSWHTTHGWDQDEYVWIFSLADYLVSLDSLLSDGDSVYSHETLLEILGTPEKMCLVCTGIPVKICWKFGSREYLKSLWRVTARDACQVKWVTARITSRVTAQRGSWLFSRFRDSYLRPLTKKFSVHF